MRRDLNEPAPQIEAELQHSWLQYYGISATRIGELIKYAIDGQRITRIFNGEEEVFFRVSVDENDKSLEELDNLLIKASNGQLIPLKKLVRWKQSDALASIDHFNGERVIRVSSGIDSSRTDPIAVFDQILTEFAGKDYQGAHLVVTGQILETQQAQQGFLIAIALALAGIAILLMILFDRVAETLVVLSVIPFGISGVLLILLLHGKVLSFFAIIGMIALLGITVNNSLILV